MCRDVNLKFSGFRLKREDYGLFNYMLKSVGGWPDGQTRETLFYFRKGLKNSHKTLSGTGTSRYLPDGDPMALNHISLWFCLVLLTSGALAGADDLENAEEAIVASIRIFMEGLVSK